MACFWTASFLSVTGTGRAVILTESEDIRAGLKILLAQYSDRTYDLTEEDLAGVIVIRVEIEEITGRSSVQGLESGI